MMIRYFAQTDDSDTGRVALEYARSLLRIGPVRLLAITGSFSAEMHGRWRSFSPLLATPMTEPYINVVCCHPSRWSWEQQIAMPNVDPQGNVVSSDTARGRAELYTRGVRNVLLATVEPPPLPVLEPALATALRYQAFVVPTLELGARWGRLDCRPHVIPVPVLDHAAFRAVVAP